MDFSRILIDGIIVSFWVLAVYAAWKWVDSYEYFHGRPLIGRRLFKTIISVVLSIIIIILVAWKVYLPNYAYEPDLFLRWNLAISDVIRGF